jgi:hypothetical protein
MSTPTDSTARARRSFWALVLVAILTTGALSAALKSNPSPITGAIVAISGIVLAITLGLATRVLIALDRARRARPRGR